MMDVSLTDEALELLKLLEKGAKHTPEGTALEQLREHGFAMGSPLKTHITQKGARHLAELGGPAHRIDADISANGYALVAATA